MPFRRRTSRRPRRRRRNRRPARRMRRTRRLMPPTEQKNVDMNIFFAALESDGEVVFLNGAAQGVSQNNRIGRQQVNASVFVKYQIKVGDTAVNAPVLTRVALFIDTRPVAGVPGLDDFWNDSSTPFAVLAHRNLDQVFRYKMLWSATHRTDVGDQTRWRSVFKRLRFRTRYNAAAATLASVATGALYFVMLSDQAATENPPSIRFVSRVRFVG